MVRRVWVLVLIILSGVAIMPARAEPAAPFPAQAGFPRTEPAAPLAFGSPVVVDLDGNGANEILLGDGAACVWGWNAAGSPLAGFPWEAAAICNGSAALETPLVVGDIDGDGKLEVAGGTRGSGPNDGQRGKVWVWNPDGSVVAGWPKEMTWSGKATGEPAISSVVLANLQGDTALEVAYSTTNNANAGQLGVDIAYNLYARSGAGTLLPVFPTWAGTAGIYGALAAGTVGCRGYADLVTGRDHGYLHSYDSSGRALAGWPLRTYLNPAADNPQADPYLALPRSAPVLGNLAGSQLPEIVVAGDVRQPTLGNATVNLGVLAVDAGGRRLPGWESPRLGGLPTSAALPARLAPALADLDGDGRLEIIAALPDGAVRAFRADGTVLWQHDYAAGRPLLASEPVIGDVSGDGKLDVVFGVYSPDGSAAAAVGVIGLDRNGQPLASFPLPVPAEAATVAQGVRAAPTLADLDKDGDVEIAAASIGGTLYVWDSPGAYNPALMPWPMARHDLWRSGAFDGGPQPAVAPTPRGPFAVFLPLMGVC